MRVAKCVLLGTVLFFVSSCAAVGPVPNKRAAQATAAIRAADEIGAADIPAARLHMKLAQEKVRRAQRLIREGENDAAAVLLDRAAADAEVAVVLTRAVHERRQANEAQARLRDLRRQRAEMRPEVEIEIE